MNIEGDTSLCEGWIRKSGWFAVPELWWFTKVWQGQCKRGSFEEAQSRGDAHIWCTFQALRLKSDPLVAKDFPSGLRLGLSDAPGLCCFWLVSLRSPFLWLLSLFWILWKNSIQKGLAVLQAPEFTGSRPFIPSWQLLPEETGPVAGGLELAVGDFFS